MEKIENEEKIREYAQSLSNRIWVTRKCRINASERLETYAAVTKFFQIYYSTISFIMTIANFYFFSKHMPNDFLTLLLPIYSSATLFFSLFFSSQNFKERAICFKGNYHKLDRLNRELEYKLEVKQINYSDIEEIEKRYLTSLENSANHAFVDLIRYQWDEKYDDYFGNNHGLLKKAKNIAYANVLFYRWYGLAFAFFIAPLILIYYSVICFFVGMF